MGKHSLSSRDSSTSVAELLARYGYPYKGNVDMSSGDDVEVVSDAVESEHEDDKSDSDDTVASHDIAVSGDEFDDLFPAPSESSKSSLLEEFDDMVDGVYEERENTTPMSIEDLKNQLNLNSVSEVDEKPVEESVEEYYGDDETHETDFDDAEEETVTEPLDNTPSFVEQDEEAAEDENHNDVVEDKETFNGTPHNTSTMFSRDRDVEDILARYGKISPVSEEEKEPENEETETFYDVFDDAFVDDSQDTIVEETHEDPHTYHIPETRDTPYAVEFPQPKEKAVLPVTTTDILPEENIENTQQFAPLPDDEVVLKPSNSDPFDDSEQVYSINKSDPMYEQQFEFEEEEPYVEEEPYIEEEEPYIEEVTPNIEQENLPTYLPETTTKKTPTTQLNNINQLDPLTIATIAALGLTVATVAFFALRYDLVYGIIFIVFTLGTATAVTMWAMRNENADKD